VCSPHSLFFLASIPINPPSGTPPPPPGELLKDVQMSEEPLPNGSHHNGLNGDVIMNDARVTSSPTPEAPPDSSMASPDGSQPDASMSSHLDDNDGDKPRPAKRARMHSDADQASLAHVSSCHFFVRQYGRANSACLMYHINKSLPLLPPRLLRPTPALHLQPLPLPLQLLVLQHCRTPNSVSVNRRFAR
jgi:hypothetical protein